MKGVTMLAIVVGSILISLAVYRLTGGRFVFFFLPLLFVLPFLGRRGR
jgi:hypothetical protein